MRSLQIILGSLLLLIATQAAASVPDTLEISFIGRYPRSFPPRTSLSVINGLQFKTNGEADVRELYVLVEGRSSKKDSSQETVAQALHNIQLRDPTSGRTIDGVVVPGATKKNAQVYLFKDFIVNDGEVWLFRLSPSSLRTTLDQFRVTICARGSANPTQSGACPFAGGLFQSRADNIQSGDWLRILPEQELMGPLQKFRLYRGKSKKS